jgi:uncharacterized protein YecE (DUF72 family)
MTDEPELGPDLDLDGHRVLTGSCSWTDRTLVEDGDFYPRRTMSAEDRLRFYASRFPLAEIDSTYYGPPAEQQAALWAERVPAGFRFDVKAYSLLTGHPTRPKSLWADLREGLPPALAEKRNLYAHHLSDEVLEEAWRRFGQALGPLREAGKLGAILFQYPPWFGPRRKNREELEALPERLSGYRVCVEFRSPRWLSETRDRDRTLDLLRQLGLIHVGVDAPASSGLPRVLEVTNPDLLVVRLHGRADSTWSARTRTAAERFNYLYDESELRALVEPIAGVVEEAAESHLLMNNCYRDYSVRNAAQLHDLLARYTAR